MALRGSIYNPCYFTLVGIINWYLYKSIMLNLENKTAKQKAQLKSKELAKVKISKFKKGDFDIDVELYTIAILYL